VSTSESRDFTPLADLAVRLERAGREIDALLRDAEKVQDNEANIWRLRGKLQGIRLALDYMRAYQ
jgi:hypothetical protein